MSMLVHLFDNDWCQRRDIEDLRSQVNSANSRMDFAKFTESQFMEKVERLEGRVGQLNLLVSTLTRVVLNRQLVSKPQLVELMRQIDLEDGVEDGQLHEKRPDVPEWCPDCEAKITPGKTLCIFCGKRFDVEE